MSEIEEYFNQRASDWDKKGKKDEKRLLSLLEEAGVRKGLRVIDLGCGTGVITPLLHRITGEEVIAIDLSPNMIAEAKKKFSSQKGLRFIAGDFLEEALPTVDAVVCFDAYPHFQNRKALKEKVLSLLPKSGLFLIVHDLSRKELAMCHSGEDVSKISRSLEEPKKEASFYEDAFDVLQAKEGEHSYLITLRKR